MDGEISRSSLFADEGEGSKMGMKIDLRQARFELAAKLRELRSPWRRVEWSDQGDRVAIGERQPAGLARVRKLPDQADYGRGVDRAAIRLVVERDVAADDRDAHRLAGVGQALHRAIELPGD